MPFIMNLRVWNYELGGSWRRNLQGCPGYRIESHNSIKEMQEKPNSEFGRMEKKSDHWESERHAKYTENHKVSDYLVPYTSSGCTAMCLYCYLCV